MPKTNRICKVCGTKYYYCPSCEEEFRPNWYAMFHEENCLNIWNILIEQSVGRLTIPEAKKKLRQCDLSKQDTFNDPIQKHLKTIQNYRITKKITPKQEETSVEESNIVNE